MSRWIPTPPEQAALANVMDSESSIVTNGGNITLGGGNGTITGATFNADGTVNTPASGFAVGDTTDQNGIDLQTNGSTGVGVTINAGGGNIIMNGQGYASGGTLTNGVYIEGGSSITTIGNGTINITGYHGGGDSGHSNMGVYVNLGNGPAHQHLRRQRQCHAHRHRWRRRGPGQQRWCVYWRSWNW